VSQPTNLLARGGSGRIVKFLAYQQVSQIKLTFF